MTERLQGRLKGKVAVVTGASQGLGREIALALAREDAHVVAGARNAANLKVTAELSTGQIVPCRCDVTQAQDVEQLVRTAIERFGRLDILVNNAGVLNSSPFEEITESLWDEVMDVNVKGVFLGCKYAIPEMLKVGGGSIVNIGSVNSFIGERLNTPYVASKGAVLMLTKNLAAEYALKGIRVNVVCPGAVDTPMEVGYFEALGGREAGLARMKTFQPLTSMIPPQDVASVVLFLASSESKAMTGASVLVDGGLSSAWDHAFVSQED